MARIHWKEVYNRELAKIVEEIVAGYKPEKIVLFGSMLDPSRESNDIDLFLVKKTKLSRLGDRANEVRKFLPDQRIPVDFIVYTPEEVEKAKRDRSVLLYQISKGRTLYEKTI